MRVVLFTGKGGVGKTTVAAATASLAAAGGRKTLVVSTDPAHSLADALDQPIGAAPTEVSNSLFGMQVDSQAAFERTWSELQVYLLEMLAAGGVEPVEAHELTVLPGAEEIFALLAVRDAARAGDFDVVCVDCAPTSETLRLLRLPEALTWWMDRLYSPERRAIRSLRPLLGQLSGLPLPSDAVFAAVARLRTELADVRSLLTDPEVSTVRIVLTPEQVVIAEARRTLTALSLHGYAVDGIVANRVFPASDDAWQAGWVAAQQVQLEAIRASCGSLPVWQLPYAAGEPIGLAALRALAGELYGEVDPVAVPGVTPMTVSPTADGYALSLALPFAVRGNVDLSRRGDDLWVDIGGDRRAIALPSVLRRCAVDGARLTDGHLVIRFVPNPDQWMRG